MQRKEMMGVILDGIKRLLVLLQRETEHVAELAGFIAKPDLLERLEVVQRFERHLSEVEDWWKLSEGRLNDALREIESVLGGFRATQMGFLRMSHYLLAARLKALRKEPWFSYRQAQELADGLEDYVQLARGHVSLAELRSSYIELEQKFSSAENPSAEERIHAVMDTTPARPRPDNKRDKRLRDQALRQEMKGISGGKPSKATSNPKKKAKRDKKAKARGERVMV